MTVYASEDFVRLSEVSTCRVYALNYHVSGDGTAPLVPGQFNELAAEIGAGNTAICICGGVASQNIGVYILSSNGTVVTARRSAYP